MAKRVNTVRLTRDIQRYLTAKRSPLAPYAADIVRAGQRYGVDPRLLVAIAGAETSFATNPKAGQDITTGHNAWGWGPHIKFPSWEASIDTIARGLRKGYLDQGLTTVPAIGRKWAPLGAANDPNWLNTGWAGNVSAVMRQLGGEGAVGPAAVPFGPAPGSSAGSPGSPGFDRKGFALATLGQIAQGTYDPVRMLMEMPSYRSASAPRRGTAQTAQAGGKPTKLGKFMSPMTTKVTAGSEFASPDAEGAPAKNGTRYHAAKDWFAPAGSAVFAPMAGTIVEVKPSVGTSGQIYGGVVKVQGPDGRVFVFRHVNPLGFKVGQRVKAGAQVATVSPWDGGSTHAHIEWWKSLAGGYRFENMLDPMSVFGG